jgi:hypothetical protein
MQLLHTQALLMKMGRFKHLLICLILPIFKAITACGIQRYVVGGFGI